AAAALILAGLVADGKTSVTELTHLDSCLLYTSPSPRDRSVSRMPTSA
ncbi:hypothetical protein G6Y82_11270, partial [Staphylococcus aureus]|nr:hypothetical protein [Staphylococcus aureus]